MSDLINHVPLLESRSDVSVHVICGNVVQESSSPCTAGLQVSSLERGQAVRYTRLKQKPCGACRDALPASDNHNATPPTPPPPARTRQACDREPAAALLSTGESTGESTGKPTSPQARNETPPPPPPLLVCVLQPGAPSVDVYMCGGRQESRNCDANRSLASSTGGLNHPSPNVGSRSTTGAACIIEVNGSCAPRPSNGTIAVHVRCRPSASATSAIPAIPVPSEPLRDPTPSAAKAPQDWNIDDVVQWITMIPQCAPYAENFRRQQVDGKALLLLEMHHLVAHVALPTGPAVKILEAIRELRDNRRL